MNNMFTIGPFGRLAGVSAKVLRSYDAAGLFRPVWVDPATGYRYYSPAQLPELRRILALRELGIGLAEIARLVAGVTSLRVALDRRRSELERERREIERRLSTLEITIDAADAGGSGLDVVVRPVRPEPVALRIVPDGEDIGAAFHELESYVRDLGRRASRPPGGLAGDAAFEIFVPVSGPVPPTDRIAYRRLAGGRAATVIVRGAYDRMAEARAALERWVEAAGLQPTGPLRILYLQFGAEAELRVPRGYVVDRETDYVTELQQLVT
jgi:DNA-binding transcriptional MerR regulator